MYLDKNVANLPQLDNLYNTVSDIQVAVKPSNLVEPVQLNEKYDPKVSYANQNQPFLMPQPIQDVKLGLPEASVESPFIHSLVSNGRLYRTANYSKECPYPENQKENIFRSLQEEEIQLKNKLNQRFGNPEIQEYIQPVTVNNHDPNYLSRPRPKIIEQNRISINERNYNEQLVENVKKPHYEIYNSQQKDNFKKNTLQQLQYLEKVNQYNNSGQELNQKQQLQQQQSKNISQQQQNYDKVLQKKMQKSSLGGNYSLSTNASQHNKKFSEIKFQNEKIVSFK